MVLPSRGRLDGSGVLLMAQNEAPLLAAITSCDEDLLHWAHRTRYDNAQRNYENAKHKRAPASRSFMPPVAMQCHPSRVTKGKLDVV